LRDPAPIRPWPMPDAALRAGEVLRRGMAQGEISVSYQPVVRLADRRPMLVEALARWQSDGQAVAPAEFVPLAEAAGLIGELLAIVTHTAIAELGPLWPRLRLGVTINLPLPLLLRPGLPAWLDRARARSPLTAGQVALELTESERVQDLGALRRALGQLRHAGYGVLLDDIAPHDGRTRLHALPFTGLKLDRGVVARLSASAATRQAVRRLVLAADRRGQMLIAEGVSEPAQWGALRALGVHAAQGFAVGRPIPAAQLTDWSAGWRRALAPTLSA
jgi:EAL domain-containing protein (putative c-di-GMP-specific phosphodiesterase class I)